MTDRIPPHSLDAERSVLGACLIDPEAIHKVAPILRRQSFYRQANENIFAAMLTLRDKREPVDFITVKNALIATGTLGDLGGEDYLFKLTEEVPTSVHAVHYAGIVAECAARRNLLASASRLMASASDMEADLSESVRKHHDEVQEIQSGRFLGGGAVSIDDAMDELLRDLETRTDEQVRGITTGFHDLDKAIGPIEPGWLFIIAGRPGVGKTISLFSIADWISLKHGPTLLVESELSRMSSTRRLLASSGRIPGQILRAGRRTDLEALWERIYRARGELHQRKLYILDKRVSLDQMEAEAQKIKRKHGALAAVLHDRAELLLDVARRPRGESEYDALSRASNRYQEMAVELDTAVGVVVQLSREVEKRADKRPVMSDLRGSGHFEQDARLILMAYRDEYYYGDKSEKPGIIEISAVKANESECGTVDLNFKKEFPAIENRAPAHRAEPYDWTDRMP